VDRQLWSILASLCPIAIQRLVECADSTCAEVPPDHVTVGCRSWPPPWKGPDGRAPENLSPNHFVPQWDDPTIESAPFLPLEAQYDGAFTRPGATQKLLYFENCRAMDGMTITGCAVVVEKRQGQWTAEAFHREAAMSNCITSQRSDGRDLLVCHSGMGAYLQAIVTSLFYVDFTQPDDTVHGEVNVPNPGGARRTRIAALVHNGFDIPCEDVPAPGSSDEHWGFWSGGIVHLSNGELTSRDVNRDGRADVIFEVDRHLAPASAEMSARIMTRCQQIRASDANARGEIAFETLLSKPTRFQLQFLNDGRKLVPTAGTHRVLQRWGGAPRYVW